MLTPLTEQLARREPLSPEQVRAAVALLASDQPSPQEKAAFLTRLAEKGETTSELTGFASELRKLSIQPDLDPTLRSREILDVCGTGGDRLNTFNISTTVALLAASGGVVVAKHGNRAITSASGSADVLEALGIRIDLSPAEAAAALAEHHFAFLFAPNYHPAFRNIAPARRLCAEAGQRTIFNLLGPLLNPVRPTVQLLGVPRPQLCEPFAHVLQSLGSRRAMVVCGSVGDAYLDELSTLGINTVAEFHHDRAFASSTFSPHDFPLSPATLQDLTGGDRHVNAAIVTAILSGKDRGPRREAVLLNASAALFLGGVTRSMSEGWDLAGKLIDSGKARSKLDDLVAASRGGGAR
ncbi:MAG TPA: anthranilate phosphoribosyltransferase [Verrucomicrobiales bacterium]|nr:anthranilate phosphoribosyltransferase [Verrucomicrobiales bacterium]